MRLMRQILHIRNFLPKRRRVFDKFVEADHPRGQPKNAGQFVESGGGGAKSEPSKPAGAKPSEKPSGTEKTTTTGTGRNKPKVLTQEESREVNARQKSWQKTTPTTDLEKLLLLAPKGQKVLADACNEIADKVGVEFADPGAKSPARIVEKVIRDGKSARQITDAVRGGWDVPTPEKGDEIVKLLEEKFGKENIGDEGWRTLETRYFDRAMKLKLPDGQIAEIQMWAPGLLAEKNVQHSNYEEWQKLPDGSPRKWELFKTMYDAYSKVCDGLPEEWKGIC